MEDRLKRLRPSMQKTAFGKLEFTEQLRQQVLGRINREDEEEIIRLTVLQLLMQDRTGYELTRLLRSRGIRTFEEEEEGFLYTLLHGMEQEAWIESGWDSSGAKYYRLKEKGRKILKKAEQKNQSLSLRKDWVQE